MQIATSLGKVAFVIECDAIAGKDEQAARDLLALQNILFHKVGSAFRPETYSPAIATKLLETIKTKLGKLFSVKSFEHSEWFKKETTSVSLAGCDADFIAEMKKAVEANKAKAKQKPKAAAVNPDEVE